MNNDLKKKLKKNHKHCSNNKSSRNNNQSNIKILIIVKKGKQIRLIKQLLLMVYERQTNEINQQHNENEGWQIKLKKRSKGIPGLQLDRNIMMALEQLEEQEHVG